MYDSEFPWDKELGVTGCTSDESENRHFFRIERYERSSR